jgi:metal-responsive CopG/Arc/MetJ family transcriptional regulator
MTRKTIAISLDIQMIFKIDKIRGFVPRSRFIENALCEILENEK